MIGADRPPHDLRARVLAAAAKQPATAPGAWSRRVIVCALLAVGWMVALTAGLGVRQDWHQLPVPALLQTLFGLTGVALLTSVVGTSRGPTMAGTASSWLWVVLALVPAVLFAIVALADPRGPETLVLTGWSATFARALRCDLLVVAVALPLIACAWAVCRGLILARPGLAGACVGLSAASGAHVVVRIHCAVGGTNHAVVAHLLPAIPLMVLAGWVFAASSRGGLDPQSSKRGRSGRLPNAQS